MLQLINQLFINSTILFSSLFLANLVFKENTFLTFSNFKRSIIFGAGSGILACILMFYSLEVSSSTIIDFRHVPLIIASIYSGITAVMTSALIIGTFRIFFFGITQSSITAFVVAILISLGLGLISKLSLQRHLQWLLSVIYVCLVASVALIFLMPGSSFLGNILLIYWIGHGVVSFAVYYLIEYITTSNQLYSQMKDEIRKDYLTGLYNVRQFESQFKKSMSNAKERHENLSLLFLDIDFFKKVNDQYGHVNGDLVLKDIGKILSSTCRSFDIISRNGGEEFSVILLGCSLMQAVEVAERIRSNVEMHNFKLTTGERIKVTISIGVSSFPETTALIEKLLEEADSALYTAKSAGRNRVSVAGHL